MFEIHVLRPARIIFPPQHDNHVINEETREYIEIALEQETAIPISKSHRIRLLSTRQYSLLACSFVKSANVPSSVSPQPLLMISQPQHT